LCLLALGVTLIGYQLFRALTSTPGTSVDYPQKLVELAESVAPGGGKVRIEDNAHPLLARVVKLRDDTREQIRAEVPDLPPAVVGEYDLLWKPFVPGSADETDGNDEASYDRRRDVARRFIEGYRKAGIYDLLDQIATKPLFLREKQPGHLLEMVLLDLGAVRDIARACGARMHLARGKDAKEFADAFQQAMGVARVCAADPVLISHLVGIAIRDHVCAELREALVRGEVPPGALDRIAATLERQSKVQPISFAIQGEELSTLDIIQWAHTEDGRRIVASARSLENFSGGLQSSGSRLLNLAAPLYPSKQQVTAMAQDYYARLREYSSTPPAARAALKWDPAAFMRSLDWNDDLLKVMLPALDRAVLTADGDRADTDGLRVVVAIERYRAAHGSLPKDLGTLVPEFLAEVPDDWFAPKGATMKYRVLPAPDSLGRTYLVYSVGEDGRDDGGVETPIGLAPPGRALPLVPSDRVINRVKTERK
jgi:hypothetical protein